MKNTLKFNNQYIEYRYKLHKFNPIWLSLVSRSINIIDLLDQHDWLRRRAGSEYGESEINDNELHKIVMPKPNSLIKQIPIMVQLLVYQ